MKGNETRLVEFMDGSKKRFVIPVYQRNYDWKQENCKQLFDDLVKVEKGGRRTHFFGSIVSVYQPSGRTTEFLADAFGFSSEAHHLYLNEFIARQETWTEAEITQRANDLADRAKGIWQYPTTSYNPPRPEVFAYGIVAHRPGFFTNSKPVAFRFRGVEYRTDSWTTIARQVLTLLAKESGEKLHAAAAKSSTIRLATHKTDTLVMEEFAPDTFACCHGSVWEKCNVMKQALAEYADLDVEVVFNNPIEDEEDE